MLFGIENNAVLWPIFQQKRFVYLLHRLVNRFILQVFCTSLEKIRIFKKHDLFLVLSQAVNKQNLEYKNLCWFLNISLYVQKQ